MEELWKDINGFEGYYQISNLGRVKSLGRFIYNSKTGEKRGFKKEKIKVPKVTSDGYFSVTLSVDGKSKTISVHRLVALHFISNPFGYKEVNHIDTNRQNNRIDNLEWCTHQHNVAHSANLGHYQGNSSGSKNGKARQLRITKDNETICFDCINDGAAYLKKLLNLKPSVISIHGSIYKSIKNNRQYRGYWCEII